MITIIILAILAMIVEGSCVQSLENFHKTIFTALLALIMNIYIGFTEQIRVLEIFVVGFIGFMIGILLGDGMAVSEI
jgi:carbon starvation protein CstA